MITIKNQDCIAGMKELSENSVDSIVTDPPYELGFMGKSWDSTGIAYNTEVWKECLRVLKPGGHLLAFGGTRTYHRMACAIEDSGFEIRDQIMWLYGCLSEDTEILTSNGWERYHKDIINSLVCCFDSKTNNFEFAKPIRDYFYANKYPAYRIQSDHTDQLVSRNHRVLVEREGKFSFQWAETCQQQENIPFLESLCDLPETIPNKESSTSIAKQSLLERVFEKESIGEDVEKEFGNSKSRTGRDRMCALQKETDGSRKITKRIEKILFKLVPFKSSRTSSTSPLCKRERKEKFEQGTEARKKSGMEGWRNIFQNTWKLCRSKIYQMSERIFIYGEKGWICHGASFINGEKNRKMFNTNRGGSSYRPRSEKQCDRKFNAVFNESGTQIIRRTTATIAETEYDGNVWCVEVPSGAFVARRNGKIFITGNSGFPKSMNISKAIDARSGFPERGREFKIWLDNIVETSKLTQKEINDACGFTMRYFVPPESDSTGWGCTFPSSEKWKIIKTVLSIETLEWDSFIDGVEREIISTTKRKNSPSGLVSCGRDSKEVFIDTTSDTTEQAKKWNGWGTALKPANEPIVLARKPLSEKTIAANVLKHDTGGLNIDACRIATQDKLIHGGKLTSLSGDERTGKAAGMFVGGAENTYEQNSLGRFPANIILDEEAGKILDEQSGISKSTGGRIGKKSTSTVDIVPAGKYEAGDPGFGDSGGASRFFYCPKTSQSERNEGLEHRSKQNVNDGRKTSIDNAFQRGDTERLNIHPTVKPIALMEYLIKLVTPESGTVLDPFMGSGSTGIAAVRLNRSFIGFELEKEYFEIAESRIKHHDKEKENTLSSFFA